jgi:protein TonB
VDDPDDVTQIGGAPYLPPHADDVTQIAPPPVIPPSEARLAEAPPAVAPYPDERPRGGASRRRRPWVVPAALAALTLGGMAAFAAMQGGGDDPAAPVAVVADSATAVDSVARADSVRGDSVRLALAQEDSLREAAEARADSVRRAQEQARIQRARDSILGAPPPADTGLIRPDRGASNGRGGDDDNRVYNQSEVESAPRLRNRDAVARELARSYPGGERRAGQAVVRFVVGADGRVSPGTVSVVSASDPAFEQSARRVVERLRFEPARRGGQPVAMRAELPLSWNP